LLGNYENSFFKNPKQNHEKTLFSFFFHGFFYFKYFKSNADVANPPIMVKLGRLFFSFSNLPLIASFFFNFLSKRSNELHDKMKWGWKNYATLFN